MEVAHAFQEEDFDDCSLCDGIPVSLLPFLTLRYVDWN